MLNKNWVQFTWDLTELPATPPALEKHYQLVEAKHSDAEGLEVAMTRAYFSEQAWTTDLPARVAEIRKLIEDDLPDQIMTFLTIRHGSRIIAAAIANPDPDVPNNIPGGVCVLSEYRSRGLGSFLLYQTLEKLKSKGLRTARTITKKGVTSARYLYPKFGGKAEDAASPTATAAK